MADEIITQDAPQVEETATSTTNDFTDKLATSWLSDNQTPIEASKPQEAAAATQAATPPATEQAPEPSTPTGDEEEIFDENDYVKNKYGYENADALINEINAWKENKDKVFEWKDDTSKRIAELINEGKLDDLYSHLHSKKQIEKLSTADLNNNKNIAAELVKFGIQKDNPNLTQDEVDFLFSQNYSLPEKPVQRDDELDDDFQARMNAYTFQVGNIEKKLIIDAKIQQPKLAQLNSELVLPHIEKEVQQPQFSQKDLDDLKQLQTSSLESANKFLNDFSGFSQQVKDKDVDYTVSYAPSKEEKELVSGLFNNFVQKGFDANELFRQRWVEADGKTVKTEQVVKDLLRMYGGENMAQKLTIDSANQRLEAYIKEKKQITDFSRPNQQGTFNPDKPSKEDALVNGWLSV